MPKAEQVHRQGFNEGAPEAPGALANAGPLPEHWYVRLLSSLYLATFLIRFSFGMILLAFPIYTGVKEFGSFGILAAAAPAAELVVVLIAGPLMDRHGRRNVLLFGLLVAAASNFLISQTTNYSILLVVNALHGVSSGTILVSSLALLADYVPLEHRGREIGMFDGINLGGWGIGFAAAGFLVGWLGGIGQLHLLFVLGGVVALGGFVWAYFNLFEPAADQILAREEIEPTRVLRVLTRPSVFVLVVPWVVIYSFIGLLLAFGPKSATQDFGLPPEQVGLLFAVVTIGFIFFQRGYGSLSDRWGRTVVMGIGVSGIVLLLLTTAGVYLAAEDPNDASELLGIITKNPAVIGLFGLGLLMAGGFAPAALAALADQAHADERGITMSLYSVAVSLGQIIGPAGAGPLIDRFGGIGTLAFLGVGGAVLVSSLAARRFLQTSDLHAAIGSVKEAAGRGSIRSDSEE